MRLDPPHGKIHNLRQCWSEAIPQRGPRRPGRRAGHGDRIRSRCCIAEGISQHADEGGHLADINRCRRHAERATPVAEDHCSLIRVLRDTQVRSTSPGIWDVEPIRECTHSLSMHLVSIDVDRNGVLGQRGQPMLWSGPPTDSRS